MGTTLVGSPVGIGPTSVSETMRGRRWYTFKGVAGGATRDAAGASDEAVRGTGEDIDV